MFVRILQTLSTTEGPFLAGQTYELPDPQGARWIRVGLAEKATPPISDTVLITGGLGDIFALDSHLDFSAKKSVWWGTRVAPAAIPLFRQVWPHLEHRILWDDFSDRFDFWHKAELAAALKQAGRPCPDLLWVEDWSIGRIFPKIHAGLLPFHGSTFLQTTLAPIDHLDLPDCYTVVCPFSTDKRRQGRDFSAADWQTVPTPVVILNAGADTVPTLPGIIDLSNHTSLAESIEILKKAGGYFGIDSALATLAAQLFPPERCRIKSINPQYALNAAIYAAPWGGKRKGWTLDRA